MKSIILCNFSAQGWIQLSYSKKKLESATHKNGYVLYVFRAANAAASLKSSVKVVVRHEVLLNACRKSELLAGP